MKPELFEGFSKLSRTERMKRLEQMGALTAEDIQFLDGHCKVPMSLAEKFIENVIGYYPLPMGVATHFRIDGVDRVIPMAVEETSIIAALSKTAKWIKQNGEIKTWVTGDCIIGQIQIAKVKNYDRLCEIVATHREQLIQQANHEVVPGLVARGGGVRDITVRRLARPDNQGDMAILHVTLNACDAMGANMVIQICEYLKNPISELTGETVTMCILSNLSDTQLTTAQVVLHDIDADLGTKIQEASFFAETDPYRAATHNKGVLNGMDPLLIATGNDWRAVEAGVHAYACRENRYQAISTWRYDAIARTLTGTLTAPIAVGTVGGMTRLHPAAQMSLRMLKVERASELARIVAAVGLVQNLGALRALITLGFTEGHMKLHLTNLSLSAGATPEEMPALLHRLEEFLERQKRITLTHAAKLLAELRRERVVKPAFATDI